jgi:hypothetical protein
MLPVSGLRRPRGVHGPDAGIEQRPDRLVGMPRAAGIVRVVDDAGDAGIDASERSDEIAGIHVLRPVALGE